MQQIGSALEEIRIGAARSCQKLTMFPLLGGRAGDPDYVTLDEALAKGTGCVTEISEGGRVPELRFVNSGAHAVLLLDGEELVGAKQNRILNLTILAPAGKTLTIPVSCVEAGRWARRSAEFAAAPRAHYAAGRARKVADVSASSQALGGCRLVGVISRHTRPQLWGRLHKIVAPGKILTGRTARSSRRKGE